MANDSAVAQHHEAEHGALAEFERRVASYRDEFQVDRKRAFSVVAARDPELYDRAAAEHEASR